MRQNSLSSSIKLLTALLIIPSPSHVKLERDFGYDFHTAFYSSSQILWIMKLSALEFGYNFQATFSSLHVNKSFFSLSPTFVDLDAFGFGFQQHSLLRFLLFSSSFDFLLHVFVESSFLGRLPHFCGFSLGADGQRSSIFQMRRFRGQSRRSRFGSGKSHRAKRNRT